MAQTEEHRSILRRQIEDRLAQAEGRIGQIRLYLKHIHAVKRFSFGTWSSRQHVIISIPAQEKTGYAESIMSINEPQASLGPWRELLRPLAGMEVGEALHFVRTRQDVWPEQLVEMTEMALADLCGKLCGRPSVELMGLAPQSPVCGVHVILSDDLTQVAQSAEWAREQGISRFIKVKLFGKTELDCAVIQTVRRCCPAGETYLIGDVNCGYRPEAAQVPLETIARAMHALHGAGLDACEDPAFLAPEEWTELQRQVLPLDLIVDYPMRPSRRSVRTIQKGMGNIYNIHPDSAGSIIDAAVLAGRIRELGAGLMIGDDSLVGPSATVWQQLAGGLGALWVEATEKREESDFYYRCVKEIATDSRRSPIAVSLKDGFGLALDEELLSREADAVEVVSE